MKQFAMAAVLAVFTSGAFAADAAIEDVVVVAEAYNWSGIYVGVQGGYGWGQAEIEPDEPPFEYDHDVEGGFGGGHAAVRWQLNNFTIGAEAEINASGIDGSVTRIQVGPLLQPMPTTFGTDIKWFGSLSAELGLPVDRFLLSVTGGVAFADIDYHTNVQFGGTTVFDQTDNASPVGWTAGLGVDYAVTDHWLVGARYRYYDFGDDSFTINGFETNFKTDLQTVTVKAAYKF